MKGTHFLSQPQWDQPDEKDVSLAIRGGHLMNENIREYAFFQRDPQDPEFTQLCIGFFNPAVPAEEYGPFVILKEVDPWKLLAQGRFYLPLEQIWEIRRSGSEVELTLISYLNEALYEQYHVRITLGIKDNASVVVTFVSRTSGAPNPFYGTIPREQAAEFIKLDAV